MWIRTRKKLPDLLESREYLLRTRSRLLSMYSAAVIQNDGRQMRDLHLHLEQLNRLLQTLREVEIDSLTGKPASRRFVISSLFLHECSRELTVDSREQFFFVTGPEADGILTLDQKCGFEHVSRTAVAAEGELKSTHQLLCRLEKFGHRLLAHFHSHPGRGVGATVPSSVDRSFQDRLERGGYPTVAAIFSRDGLVRFFRLDGNFEMSIHGKGVEEIEPHVYRLTNLN